MSISPFTGLLKVAVEASLISQADANAAQKEAERQHTPIATLLVTNYKVSATQLAERAAQIFKIPLLDLKQLDYDVVPADLISERLIRQHNALPLYQRANRLYVAVSDPTNLDALNEFKFQSGVATEAILVAQDKLTEAIEKVLAMSVQTTFSDLDDADLDALDISTEGDLEDIDFKEDDALDDVPIVRFINKILLDGINMGASDIHFEPYEKHCRIRVRLDGILKEVAKPPITTAPRIAARLKVMSRLDISERRVPQDGRFKMKLSPARAIDFRVSTCPTLFGEKVVMRILDPSSASLGIDALGYEEIQKQRFLEAIKKPQGMILVTGPTGSGKTVSLYTALNILNTDEVNISTAEDPVEINIPGLNQVNINPKAGLTFASALHAFLRQDPDIIMVGEVRDLETAEIAIKAAQTGHLVLSTLHTNSAPETLTRLLNMGIPSYNLATSVTLIIAQRLARRLCPYCHKKAKVPKESLRQAGFRDDELDELQLFEAVGCEHCHEGYKGRVGIYEVMPITPDIARIIMSEGNALDIAAQAAKEGFCSLRESGLNKVRQGLTSLQEINRVTKG